MRVGYGFEALSLSSGVEYVCERYRGDGRIELRPLTWLFRNNLQYQMNADCACRSPSSTTPSRDSSLGDFFDGGFTEGVFGYAYRPGHDR